MSEKLPLKGNTLNDIRITSISYGSYKAVSYLHRNFQKGVKRMRVGLEINRSSRKNARFQFIFHQLLQVLPTLASHQCCERWMGPEVAPELGDGIPMKKLGGNTDLAHLIEHIMIDLICRLGDMKTCSGLTCGFQSPKNRFDLFVESSGKKVGAFSANLAVFMVNSLLMDGKLPPHVKETIQLAKMVFANPRRNYAPAKISALCNWDVSLSKYLRRRLEKLELFPPAKSLSAA
ncbi:MAG: hypothetical protein L0Y74_08400, partial [candidate division Zixibacteria bacterium]|nr:hypothetical protein [candidate division Zixibacteria bacterium]